MTNDIFYMNLLVKWKLNFLMKCLVCDLINICWMLWFNDFMCVIDLYYYPGAVIL